MILRSLLYNKRVNLVIKILQKKKKGLLLNIVSIKNLILNMSNYLLQAKMKYSYIIFNKKEFFKDNFNLIEVKNWNSLDDFIFFSPRNINFLEKYQYKTFIKFMSNFDDFVFINIKNEINIKSYNLLNNFYINLKKLQIYYISTFIVKNLYEKLIMNEIEFDVELLDLAIKTEEVKKKKKYIYNLYFRLYNVITDMLYKISTRVLLKGNYNKYQAFSTKHIVGYFDFMVYRISDYNILDYLYSINLTKTFNYNIIADDVGSADFNYFERIEKTMIIEDFLKLRFFRFFKHYYSIDIIIRKFENLKYSITNNDNKFKFYFLLLNAVKGFNYRFLFKVFYTQLKFFKILRLNFYFKFFFNVFNIDFFFFKLYKYIIFIYKNSLIKAMVKDLILNNKIKKKKAENNFFSDFLGHFSISKIIPNFWYNVRFINFSNILKKKPYKFYKLYLYYTFYNINEYIFFKIFQQKKDYKHDRQENDNFIIKVKKKLKKNSIVFLRNKFGFIKKST